MKQICFGFTFVEVIAVSLIVAILAAVAIPVYRGYVNDAQIRDAHSRCEMIGAAIIQTRNRGANVIASTATDGWNSIGLPNPSDAVWTYSFGAYLASAANNPAYTITATGTGTGAQAGKTGSFKPYATGSARWTLSP